MNRKLNSALVLSFGAVTILSLCAGLASAQDADRIPIKIVLEAGGLTRNVEFELSVFPFLRDPKTGEPKLQLMTSDRVVLGPEQTRLVKTYTLQQGLQYQFTADIPTASGDLPDFTYALAKSEDYRTADLSKSSTVVLTLVKTPRSAENSGTFFDVSNLAGAWELAIYPGPTLVNRASR